LASEKRDPDWMSANAYDCMAILAEVIAKVGKDRAKIRDGLAAYNAPPPPSRASPAPPTLTKRVTARKKPFIKVVKDGKFVPAK
jgi:ABC-type branched-subunit amino acid transport system substrate-binding protein